MSKSTPARRRPPVQAVAVAGGCGGVGRTTVAINLAVALSQSGRRVLLLDSALGAGGVRVALGLSPRHFLEDVLLGQAFLWEAVEAGPGGISVISAGGSRLEATHAMNSGVIHGVSGLGGRFDVLVVDTSQGLGRSAMDFSGAAGHVLVVQRDDPISVTNSFSMIRALAEERHVRSFGVFVNLARSENSGREAYRKLVPLCERLLPNVAIAFWGCQPDDRTIWRAAWKQRPVVLSSPRSQAAERFRSLAATVRTLPRPPRSAGRVEFFAERLIRA